MFFLSTIIYFVFSWFICSPSFWQCFPFLQTVVLFLFHFFLLIQCHRICQYIQLLFTNLYTTRNFCILRITFCNAKLNNICDKESPYFSPVLFSKKDDNVPSILTALLVFCTHILHIFINFVGILNSSIHFHRVSLFVCMYEGFKCIYAYVSHFSINLLRMCQKLILYISQ